MKKGSKKCARESEIAQRPDAPHPEGGVKLKSAAVSPRLCPGFHFIFELSLGDESPPPDPLGLVIGALWTALRRKRPNVYDRRNIKSVGARRRRRRPTISRIRLGSVRPPLGREAASFDPVKRPRPAAPALSIHPKEQAKCCRGELCNMFLHSKGFFLLVGSMYYLYSSSVLEVTST